MENDIQRVHVVFKTHLDIGFTDYASNVIDKYMTMYIPKAIELAEELERSGDRVRFIWTTGAWLIEEFLRREDTDHARMVDAIGKGHIAWHGLPFTMHTELLDVSLLQYGLSIARRLDQRFGRQTIAAKMTDVPGHTIGIVDPLCDAGIRYLHLGVNPASPVPEVPGLFRWRSPSGREIIVNYARDYGGAVAAEGLRDIMVFAHTGDNLGPPGADSIRELFARLEEQYPGAIVQASTMDRYAAALLEHASILPVLEEEIGDSWNHGLGTDPWKVAAFRVLSRLRTGWLASGQLNEDSEEHRLFSGSLLLVAEHTWGLDEKLHLADYLHYARDRFEAARLQDSPDRSDTPAKYRHFTPFAMLHEDAASGKKPPLPTRQGSYRRMEASWAEQRDYVRQALAALPGRLRKEAEQELGRLLPLREIPPEEEEVEIGREYRFGEFRVRFDGEGAIVALTDADGRQWAGPSNRIGAFRYETFGSECYERWYQHYLRNREATHSWSEADFGKPGLEFAMPPAEHRLYSPRVRRLESVHGGGAGIVVYAELQMPEDAVRDHGAPASIVLAYHFPQERQAIELTVHWSGKPANRKPEAIWLSMNPVVSSPNDWRMHKIGEWISPFSVVRGGNRHLHALQEGVRNISHNGTVHIRSLDAALAAPGRRALLRFDHRFGALEDGWHFLLYNNVWGTNFPMWYEEDAAFRFELAFSARR